MIRNIVGGVLSIPLKIGLSAREGFSAIKEVKDTNVAQCLLIYKNVGLITDCTLSKDMMWVIPRGFNLKFRLDRYIILRPHNNMFFLINVDNPQTWHPDTPPSYDIIEEEIIDKVIEEGKEVEVYKYEEHELKGGHILSKVAYDVGLTSILRFMESKSRKELLMLALMCVFLGIVLGILMGSLGVILMLSIIG